MPLLNCNQHVQKGRFGMLQRRTNEQIHKKALFTKIHQLNEHKNHVECLSMSIKNHIRTSKVSVVFIVLASQLRNSRHWQGYKRTSRDRPKSAPYPRLKNSKKTSKCQLFSFTVLENRNFFKKRPSGAPGLASASPCRAKVSQCRKTEWRTL